MSRWFDVLTLGRFSGSPAELAPAGEKAGAYLAAGGIRRPFKAAEFFDLLLDDAVHLRATDIHVIPENDRVQVRLRIDGNLRDFLLLQPKQGKYLVNRLKVVAGMDFLNFYSPQDGAGKAQVAGQEVAFRVSSMPVQATGPAQERVIVRLFCERAFDLEALGFSSAALNLWRQLLDEPQGMLVLTGPANSGKTTTIYASLLDILRRSHARRNIATIEDPVEFPVPGLSQSQVNHADHFGFPEALRALVRQDPQVIMIGEIRDAETASIAIEASLTGHLILTTVHSKQVTGIFPRLLSLGIDAVRASSAVLAVLNQRLLPLNCPDCSAPYRPSDITLSYLPPETLTTARLMRAKGCPRCGQSGFFGRTPASELLVMDAEVRAAVRSGAPSQELYDRAIASGMTTIWQNALRLVLQGQVSLEEALQIVGTE